MAERELIVPIRLRARDRYLWNGMFVALPLIGAACIAIDPSWASILLGGVLIAFFVWLGGTRLATKRLSGGRTAELRVTRERISGPVWSVSWDRVKRIYLGETPAGALRALFIEAFDAADIELPSSTIFRLNRMLARRSTAVIAIVEKTIDRPVEQLMLDLERIAGRDLHLAPIPKDHQLVG